MAGVEALRLSTHEAAYNRLVRERKSECSDSQALLQHRSTARPADFLDIVRISISIIIIIVVIVKRLRVMWAIARPGLAIARSVNVVTGLILPACDIYAGPSALP